VEKVGRWAFIAGLVIAVLGAFFNLATFGLVLMILGLIVGFLNVSGSEAQSFLIAGIALTASAAAVQALPFVGDIVTNIMGGVVAFVTPAILVVAVKALLETAKQ
jgi:hypothetical protein